MAYINFDANYYLNKYADVRNDAWAGSNPYQHYLGNGRHEGRFANIAEEDAFNKREKRNDFACILYEGINYTGKAIYLPAGKFNMVAFGSNDKINSIKINPNSGVVLCEGFGSNEGNIPFYKAIFLDKDCANLADFSFQNIATQVEVITDKKMLDTYVGFDEAFYLKENPDVARSNFANGFIHYYNFGKNESHRSKNKTEKIQLLKKNGGIFYMPDYYPENKSDAIVLKNQNLAREVITQIRTMIGVNDLTFPKKIKEFILELNDLPNYYVAINIGDESVNEGPEYISQRTQNCGGDSFQAWERNKRDNFFNCVNGFNPRYARTMNLRKASQMQLDFLQDQRSKLQMLLKENVIDDAISESTSTEKELDDTTNDTYKVNWSAVSILGVVILIIGYFTLIKK